MIQEGQLRKTQKITQTREILCKILDKKEFSGVKVMVKGDRDSLE